MFLIAAAPSSYYQLADESVLQAVPCTYLGAQGLFTAIIVALVSVEVTRFCQTKGITIKMPDGVPPFLSETFGAIVPMLVNILIFFGKKINIVMFDAEHERIKEILEKNASTRDYKIIPVNEDSLTHVFRITEALDRREYVCFQGDRYLNKEKLLTTSFMGKEAKFPMGPFLLASKLKVPVVFYFYVQNG